MMGNYLGSGGQIPESVKTLFPDFQQYWASQPEVSEDINTLSQLPLGIKPRGNWDKVLECHGNLERGVGVSWKTAHIGLQYIRYARYMLNNNLYPSYLPYLSGLENSLSLISQQSVPSPQTQAAYHRIHDLHKDALYHGFGHSSSDGAFVPLSLTGNGQLHTSAAYPIPSVSHLNVKDGKPDVTPPEKSVKTCDSVKKHKESLKPSNKSERHSDSRVSRESDKKDTQKKSHNGLDSVRSGSIKPTQKHKNISLLLMNADSVKSEKEKSKNSNNVVRRQCSEGKVLPSDKKSPKEKQLTLTNGQKIIPIQDGIHAVISTVSNVSAVSTPTTTNLNTKTSSAGPTVPTVATATLLSNQGPSTLSTATLTGSVVTVFSRSSPIPSSRLVSESVAVRSEGQPVQLEISQQPPPYVHSVDVSSQAHSPQDGRKVHAPLYTPEVVTLPSASLFAQSVIQSRTVGAKVKQECSKLSCCRKSTPIKQTNGIKPLAVENGNDSNSVNLESDNEPLNLKVERTCVNSIDNIRSDHSASSKLSNETTEEKSIQILDSDSNGSICSSKDQSDSSMFPSAASVKEGCSLISTSPKLQDNSKYEKDVSRTKEQDCEMSACLSQHGDDDNTSCCVSVDTTNSKNSDSTTAAGQHKNLNSSINHFSTAHKNGEHEVCFSKVKRSDIFSSKESGIRSNSDIRVKPLSMTNDVGKEESMEQSILTTSTSSIPIGIAIARKRQDSKKEPEENSSTTRFDDRQEAVDSSFDEVDGQDRNSENKSVTSETSETSEASVTGTTADIPSNLAVIGSSAGQVPNIHSDILARSSQWSQVLPGINPAVWTALCASLQSGHATDPNQAQIPLSAAAAAGVKLIQDPITGQFYFVPATNLADLFEPSRLWSGFHGMTPLQPEAQGVQCGLVPPTAPVLPANSFSQEQNTENREVSSQITLVESDVHGDSNQDEESKVESEQNESLSSTEPASETERPVTSVAPQSYIPENPLTAGQPFGFPFPGSQIPLLFNPELFAAMSGIPVSLPDVIPIKSEKVAMESRGTSPIIIEPSENEESSSEETHERSAKMCSACVQTSDDESVNKKHSLNTVKMCCAEVQTDLQMAAISDEKLHTVHDKMRNNNSSTGINNLYSCVHNSCRNNQSCECDIYDDPQILTAADGLELLSTLAEKRSRCESMYSNNTDTSQNGEMDTEMDIAATIKINRHKDFSNLTKKENKPATVGTYLLPTGVDAMDAIEIEMRARLAELQRRYREKQRELARLTPKNRDRDKSDDASKRGPGRPRKRNSCHSDSSVKSPTTEQPSKKRRPTEELVDKVFRKTGQQHQNFLSKEDTLQALALYRSKASLKRRDSNDSMHSSSDSNSYSAVETSPVAIKPEETEAKKDLVKEIKPAKILDSPVKSALNNPSFTNKIKNMIKKRKMKQEESDSDTSDSNLQASNQKRKPGRPKKFNSDKVSGVTETLVNKKSKKFGFLQLREYHRAQMKKYSAMKAEEIKKKLESQPPMKPLYLDEEWFRRRSERIFLSDPSPQQSPNSLPSVSPKIGTPMMKASPQSKSSPQPKVSPQSKSSVQSKVANQPSKSTSPLTKSSSTNKAKADKAKALAAKNLQELSQRVKRKYHKSMAKKAPREKTRKVYKKQQRKRKPKRETSSDSDSSSEGDNVPLSALRDKTNITELRSCEIETEELQDGLRVLLFMEGLFYEGELKAIQAPDIYGVVIHNERGKRPHIYSREEILQEAILDVKAPSYKFLKEGTRICAYWSQQFSCLYPGTVSKECSKSQHDKNLISVEFDDGDTGRIPLDYIRMLPEKYPIVSYEPNPILHLGKRRRRTMSMSEDPEYKKPTIEKSNDQNEDAKPPVVKRGPGRPPKYSKQESTSKTEKDGSSEDDESDAEDFSSDEGDEESYIPLKQLWKWSGKSTKRPGLKGKAKKEFYKEIYRGSETIAVGECAVFLSAGRRLPYIGRVESFWESWSGQKSVRVKWFYHPEETKGGKRLNDLMGALFQSPHEDENNVQTISHKCEVLSYTEFQERKAIDKDIENVKKSNCYFLAGLYDPTCEFIQFEPDVP